MTVLYLDMGNSRAKWKLGEQLGRASYEDLPAALSAMSAQVDRVVLASVLTQNVFDRLLSEMKARLPVAYSRCRVSTSALGVRCAYEDVGKLGIDRWLVVLAAWQRYRVPCVVADLGTAATLDVVDESGHRGGYIVSGLPLALDGLLAGTQNIRPDASSFKWADLTPGTSTAAAIYNGALFSLVSLIESSYQNLLKNHSQAKLILAGGDAPIVGSHLGSHFELIEDLVFQGMQLLDEAGLVENA